MLCFQKIDAENSISNDWIGKEPRFFLSQRNLRVWESSVNSNEKRFIFSGFNYVCWRILLCFQFIFKQRQRKEFQPIEAALTLLMFFVRTKHLSLKKLFDLLANEWLSLIISYRNKRTTVYLSCVDVPTWIAFGNSSLS